MLHGSLDTPAGVTRTTALIFSEMSDGGVVITRHAADNLAGGVRLGAGRPFVMSDLEELVAILQNREDSVSLLPDNVLHLSSHRAIWTVPGRVRPMWFAATGRAKKPFTLNVPWPNLLFVVARGKLSIAAYKGRGRPNADTPLYHAPLQNIYSSLAVCVGNADLPGGCGLQHMAGWEAVIFDTMFSHTNHDHTLSKKYADKKGWVSTERNVAFWRGLAKAKTTAFPADALQPTGFSLGSYLKRQQ